MTTPSSRGSWDTQSRPVRAARVSLLALAGVALVPAAGQRPCCGWCRRPTTPTALVASFIAYGVLGYALALVCLVRAWFGPAAARRTRRARVVVLRWPCCTVLASYRCSWPTTRPGRPRRRSRVALNLRRRGRPAVVVGAANSADIVVLVEATPAALQALQVAGLGRPVPVRAVGDSAASGVSGTACLLPLPDHRTTGCLIGHRLPAVADAVEVPDIGPVELLAVHPCNPYCGGNRWDGSTSSAARGAPPIRTRPVVVAGDFNAVDDQGRCGAAPTGLPSATDVAGAGWLPTYPADRADAPAGRRSTTC